MSETIKEIYDSLNKLDDLRRLISESEDGESPWLEFKAIKRQPNEKDKEFIKHQKSLLAKEICAFLNTSDGIIVWGVEYEKGKLAITNDLTENLYDLLDRCIKTIVQPSPKGIDFKTLTDNKKNALIIFVPRSDILPHRVWGEAESDYRRNYYARSGTNSISLDEGLIRSLYLSKGRTPRISVYTEPFIESDSRISLNVYAKPDSTFFVDRYYDCEEFFLLDGLGNHIEIEEDGSLWTELNYIGQRANYPIYPSNNPILLFSNYISMANVPKSGTFVDGLMELPSISSGEDIDLSKEDFEGIKLIFTKSQFACDNVPLIIDRKLYITGSMAYEIKNRLRLGKNSFAFNRNTKFKELEEKYNIEIFIMETYTDDEIIDDLNDGALRSPSQSNLPLSWLDSILERYSGELK